MYFIALMIKSYVPLYICKYNNCLNIEALEFNKNTNLRDKSII